MKALSKMVYLSTIMIVALLLSLQMAHAQNSDLTGLWLDNAGDAVYRVRQIGNKVYWSVDGTSKGSYANVFFGEVSGNTINGTWVDLPGSPTLGGGNLRLRIESNSRMVKIGESIPYGASIWTRQGEGGGGTSRCGLGRIWDETEEGWTQVWTRRGDSNVFDVRGTKPGMPTLTAVQTIEIRENRVFVYRTWASDGNTCEHEGTIAADGVTVTGTYRCGIYPGPFSWRATIRCDGSGSSGSGGICDDPRSLSIMDEWLGRAIPPQKPGESLRYEAWGRLVGRSLTANVTVSGPPDTPLTRCEYLWQRASQLRSTNLGTLKEYVERRR